MFVRSLWNSWRSKISTRSGCRRRARIARTPVRITEMLESRALLSAYTLSVNGSDIEVIQDGDLVHSQDVNNATAISIIGAVNDSDTLTIDFAGGNPIPGGGVTFDGLGGPGIDSLVITGGTFTTNTYTATGPDSGSIDLDGSVVTYLGLEPITNTGTVADVIFNLPGTADMVTLTNPAVGQSKLSGSTFENTTFLSPTGSLTINGASDDSLLFGTSAYTLSGGLVLAGIGTVTGNQDLTLGSLTWSGTAYTQSPGTSLTSAGVIDLDASNAITFNGAATGTSLQLASAGTSGSAIRSGSGSALAATAGNAEFSTPSGGVFLRGNLTVTGGNLVSSGMLSFLTAGTLSHIDTNGGLATFTHSNVGLASMDTEGGAIHTTMKLLTTDLANLMYVETGDIVYYPGSTLYIDPSAVDIPSTPPPVHVNVIRSNTGVIIGFENLSVSSGLDIDGSDTAFYPTLLTVQQDRIQFTALEAMPIVITGAGDYRIVRDPQGPGVNDDLVEVYQNTLLIAQQLYLGTNYISITGASGANDDSLEVDFSGGNPVPVEGVSFDGLGGGGVDTLSVTNGTRTNMVFSYTGTESGTIRSDGYQISFSEVEASTTPISVTGTTLNAVFNVPAAATTVTLSELAGGESHVSGGGIATTKMVDPTVSLTINGDSNDQITVGGANSITLATASLTLDGNGVDVNQSVTVGGAFNSSGAASFETNSTSTISSSGAVTINHIGTVTIRNSVTGTSVNVTSDGGGGNAIFGSAAAAVVTATTGDVTMTATAGGVNFEAGELHATLGSVDLDAATNVQVKVVTAGGTFSSLGGGTFAMSTDAAASISVGGAVTIDHGGTVTIRNDVTGASVDVTSDGGGGNAIFGTVAAAVVTATTGDLTMTATVGGVNFEAGELHATLGNVDLDAATNVQVKIVTAGGTFSSLGGGTFAMSTDAGASVSAGGAVTIDHGGTVTVRNDVTGASVDVTSDGVGGNAIFGTVAAAVVTATTGDVTMTATVGGVNFEAGELHATLGNVDLDAATNVQVKIVTAGGTFSSLGGGTFAMSTDAGASISAGGAVTIDHVGTVTIRNDVSGTSISVESDSGSGLAINGTTASATLTATAGGVSLTALSGGVSLLGAVSATGGDVDLNTGGAVSLSADVTVSGGNFTSVGTTFSTATGSDIVVGSSGSISLTHSGTKTVRGILDAGIYTVTGANAMTMTATSRLLFYVDVTAPPASPLFTRTGGNLVFTAGSTIEVVTSGVGAQVPGAITLATVSGGTLSGSFTTVKSGPRAANIPGLVTIVGGTTLEATIV